ERPTQGCRCVFLCRRIDHARLCHVRSDFRHHRGIARSEGYGCHLAGDECDAPYLLRGCGRDCEISPCPYKDDSPRLTEPSDSPSSPFGLECGREGRAMDDDYWIEEKQLGREEKTVLMLLAIEQEITVARETRIRRERSGSPAGEVDGPT